MASYKVFMIFSCETSNSIRRKKSNFLNSSKPMLEYCL